MFRTAVIKLVLRVGLGINCIGFALCSLLYPDTFIEFYPQFIPNLIGEMTTLILGALAAVGMTIWLFSKKNRFACSFTFLIVLFIALLSNITSIQFVSVVWPLFIIALALTIRYYPRVRIIVPHKDGERMKIVPIIPEDEDANTADSAGEDIEDDQEAEIDLHKHKTMHSNVAAPTKPNTPPAKHHTAPTTAKPHTETKPHGEQSKAHTQSQNEDQPQTHHHAQAKKTIISQLHEDRIDRQHSQSKTVSVSHVSATPVEQSIEEGLTDVANHELTRSHAGDLQSGVPDLDLKEEKANHEDPEMTNDSGQFIQYNPEIEPLAGIQDPVIKSTRRSAASKRAVAEPVKKKRVTRSRKKASLPNETN